MKLALFTNGSKSIAGTNNGISSVFDSLVIFQDPDLFTKRFLFQMQNRFNIKDFSEIRNLIIAVTAKIDAKNNKIIESYYLNDLSRIKTFNHFDLNLAFNEVFTREQIYVLNDAFAMALGIRQFVRKERLPSLVLTLDDGIGISFINEAYNVLTTEWAGDFISPINQQMYKALGRDSIINLLISQKIDINQEYTEYLKHSIEYLDRKYGQNNSPIKSVYILGDKTQFINIHQLNNSLKNYHVEVISEDSS